MRPLKFLFSTVGRMLPADGFARNVGILMGGTSGGQLILIAAAPILTRLYNPSDFGLLAVYSAIVSVLIVVAAFRYELAISLPEDDVEAANIVALCAIVILSVAVLIALAIFLGGPAILHLLGASELDSLVWLLPLGVLLGGMFNVFNYWSIRHHDFKLIATAQIMQVVATAALQISTFKLGGSGLVLSQTIGQMIGTARMIMTRSGRGSFRSISWNGILQMAQRHRRLPLFSTWAALFNTLGNQLPALLFATFFGAYAAGLFMLVNRVLQVPMSVIGSAVSNVFLANASSAHRDGLAGPLVRGVFLRLFAIGLPPALLMAMTAPPLFTLVFGRNWVDAGHFAQLMIPWFFLSFIFSPLSMVFTVFEREAVGLLFQLLLFILRLAAIYVGVMQDDMFWAIAMFSLMSSLCYLGVLAWILRVSSVSITSITRPIGISCAVSIACVTPTFLVLMFGEEISLTWFLAFSTSVGLILAGYTRMLRKVGQGQ